MTIFVSWLNYFYLKLKLTTFNKIKQNKTKLYEKKYFEIIFSFAQFKKKLKQWLELLTENISVTLFYSISFKLRFTKLKITLNLKIH